MDAVQSRDLQNLAHILEAIDDLDPSLHSDDPTTSYTKRNKWVYRAIARAQVAGLPAGLTIDPNPEDPQYPLVALIELPTGQISWHLPLTHLTYDGHTREDKTARVKAFVEEVS